MLSCAGAAAGPAAGPYHPPSYGGQSHGRATDDGWAASHLELPAGPSSRLAGGARAIGRHDDRGACRVRRARVSGIVFREGEYWTVRYEGLVARLRDIKGLRCLARLVADPGREFHPADLEAADSQAERPVPYVAPSGADELPVRRDLGDVGELLDARAKAAYRARLDELEEAERFNDPDHAARASAEGHFLVNELARGGRAGRPRPPSGVARRACPGSM